MFHSPADATPQFLQKLHRIFFTVDKNFTEFAHKTRRFMTTGRLNSKGLADIFKAMLISTRILYQTSWIIEVIILPRVIISPLPARLVILLFPVPHWCSSTTLCFETKPFIPAYLIQTSKHKVCVQAKQETCTNNVEFLRRDPYHTNQSRTINCFC